MKKISSSILLISALLLGICSCTGKFDEYQENPSKFQKLTPNDAAGLYAYQSVYSFLGAQYQLNQELTTDLYAQFDAMIVTYFAADRYQIASGWQADIWRKWLVQVAPYSYKIYSLYDDTTAENALSRICYVYAMETLCDGRGAIPYGAGNGEQVRFIGQKEAYHNMIDDLTKAANTLKDKTTCAFASKDRIYGGDCQKWMKFANTMRMRIALRLVNKEPEYAQQEAEKAYQAGVLTSTNEEAWYTCDANIDEWQNYICNVASWLEFGMSSTMYSYLVGWNDPRLKIYFQPNPMTNTYHCVRNGMPVSDIKKENSTTGLYVSNYGTNWVTVNSSVNGYDKHFDFPRLILPASDAFFIRAEGALRGWNMGGTAKELYEAGVKASMKSWGVSDADAATYLEGTSDPCKPNDFYDSPAVCEDLCVKYDESAGFEKNLQRICTQRWLGLFTCSSEAWALIRRSGYPILYPVIKSDDSDINPSKGEFIQRLEYPQELRSSEGEEAMKAAYEANGATEDSQATKLYFAK